jgi:predicted dehydrogenase/threonine dehydrogenase-like Zn-dependent dehydrogenase
MLQVLQNYKGGDIKIEDVPKPTLKAGGIVVKTHYSLISAGTEKYVINLAQSSLISKAKQRPDLVKQVIEKAKQNGIIDTFKKVMGKLDSPLALGYSSAGEVIEVAEDVKDIKVGDHVACAGSYAGHAEVNYVPRNLCVKVPENVELQSAAYTTVAAIALQGIRQANPKLGDNVVVIGLGLIGQLTIQMLKANGCNVIGIDVSEKAVKEALNIGIDYAIKRDNPNLKNIIKDATNGFGADSILITAGTSSNDPVELAGEIARERAVVVAVGLINMDIPRNLYYEKELEVKLSRSYGPGRYDTNYEEKGHDYPVGYVRWTEQRNMEAFLDLLSEEKIDTDILTTHTYNIENADKAYDMILNNKEDYTGVLLKYNVDKQQSNKVILKPKKNGKKDMVNLGVIGAGNFATATLFPNLKKVDDINFRALATATGVSGKSTAENYNFDYCTTDTGELINDENIDTILILTRHNLHAELVIKGLKAGKDVYVEKPLALNEKELKKIIKIYNSAKGKLMVGFNRRFSPFIQELKDFYKDRTSPLMMNYTINAGFIPEDHWVHDPEIGGGRIKGEACHFIDLLSYISDSKPVQVFTQSIASNTGNVFNDDNVSINIHFEDGSTGVVNYTALGDKSYPKEQIEVFGSSSVAKVNNFNSLETFRNNKKGKSRKFSPAKGFYEEMDSYIKAIKEGKDTPISFKELIASSLATLKAVESMSKGTPISINTDKFINNSLGSE